MRHCVVAASFTALLLLAGTLSGELAERAGAPVHAWVLTRGPAGAALNGMLGATDARVLDLWWDGRLVLLQVPGGARLPRERTWIALKLPPLAAAWAGCA